MVLVFIVFVKVVINLPELGMLEIFRNYIHPNEQISKNFNPDIHTAKLCWQVLKVDVIQLSKKMISNELNKYPFKKYRFCSKTQ